MFEYCKDEYRVDEIKDTYKAMDKEELETSITDLLNEISHLDTIICELVEDRDKLQDELDELDNGEDERIKDLNEFIWKLKLDNLYTDELEKFIENYIKFYNKD